MPTCRPTRAAGRATDRVVAVLAVVGHPVPDSSDPPAARPGQRRNRENKAFRRGNVPPFHGVRLVIGIGLPPRAVSGGQVMSVASLTPSRAEPSRSGGDDGVWRVPATRAHCRQRPLRQSDARPSRRPSWLGMAGLLLATGFQVRVNTNGPVRLAQV